MVLLKKPVMRLVRVRLHNLPVTGVMMLIDTKVIEVYFSPVPVERSLREFDLRETKIPDLRFMPSEARLPILERELAFAHHIRDLYGKFVDICVDDMLVHEPDNAAQTLYELTKKEGMTKGRTLLTCIDTDVDRAEFDGWQLTLFTPHEIPQGVFRRRLPPVLPPGNRGGGFLGVQLGRVDGLHGVQPEAMDPEEFKRLKAGSGSMVEMDWNAPPPEFPLHPDMDRRGSGRKK